MPPDPPARPAFTALRVHLERGWLPVALALVVTLASGWSILWLSVSASRVAQASHNVPGLQVDVARPELLLLETARQRLHATGPVALLPTPGVPLHELAFYTQTFRRIADAGAMGGQSDAAGDVARALRDLVLTQDGVYAGGPASLVASRHAPIAVRNLRSSFTALAGRLETRARLWEWLARGGTTLITLAAALALIVLLRRFDRMRGRLTEELRLQATHDPLTGLANRRQLTRDLARVTHASTTDRSATLVAFDLDGFKAYNDAFGHHEGDLLLTRLGRALAAAASPGGVAYRLGGDEFCVLFAGDADERAIARCIAALSEDGEAFSIGASHGCARVPAEAPHPDLAMQLADERMYADKRTSRASAGVQARDLALRMLGVQEPEVEQHSVHVAVLADGVGRRLGLSDAARHELVRAAELHDIGKIAIPYAVLHKPAPLDVQEWHMMRRHSTIGANILSAAPALARVAEIVRYSHERFDGKGYPDGVAGTNIPLASRIVFVCDSFDAMVAARPYSSPMSEEGALDELRRHAGSQFDPDVVAAFCAERTARRARDAASALLKA